MLHNLFLDLRPQFWTLLVPVLGSITASPSILSALPTTTPPGVAPDNLPPAPVAPPPWNISGQSAFFGDASLGRASLNLGYSTEPLFRAVPMPLTPYHNLIFTNLSQIPINLIAARFNFTGLGSAPLSPSKKAVKSALPLWALGLAPGEADASKRCARTG